MKKLFTIHFDAPETGESFDTGVFASREAAMLSPKYDNMGYGMVFAREIAPEESVEVRLTDAISEDREFVVSWFEGRREVEEDFHNDGRGAMSRARYLRDMGVECVQVTDDEGDEYPL